MARATRSTAQQVQDVDKHSDPANTTTRGKTASKKRKRGSIAENDEQPAAKQLRSGDVSIKEEGGSHEPEDIPGQDKLYELPNAGDVSIDPGDAQKILDILEMIDTQGLLDRVFPLLSSTAEGSSTQPVSHSFRTILKESSQHPLCVLRSAVQHLFPISSHPRSRPSTPAAQQLSFCNFALSLLDQASFHSVSIPLDLESILPFAPQQDVTKDIDMKPDVKSKSKSPSAFESLQSPSFKRKYALMQRLSGGEWWTSLNSDLGAPSTDSKSIKDLPTAHAELVAVLPTPSASLLGPKLPIPTLGAYNKKPLGPKVKFIGPRRTSCGTFLDYGPYASFAPSYEGEGVEVGRIGLGETVWRWGERRKERMLEGFKPGSIEEVDGHAENDVIMCDVQDVSQDDPSQPPTNGVVVKALEDGLEGLLPPEEIAIIKAALDTLELEEAVNELLERNRKALTRLEELQRIRLGREGGGSSEAEEGSEEWDTAQSILGSLTILASLRPRLPRNGALATPLIPSPSALRKLHRTLPVTPTQGWCGTLPPARGSALRDDSTIHIKSGTVLQATEATTTATTPATPANTTTTLSHTTYSHTPQVYRPPQQFKSGQQYYPNQVAAQPQTPGQTQTNTAQYYPNQQYGQSQYQFPSPYYYTGPTAVASGASTNGRGTPQPTTGYYNATSAAQPQAQRAVANTVVTATAAAAGKNGSVPPTLPQHLRNTTWSANSSQPGTPIGVNGGYQYGTYQPTSAK